MEAEAPDGSRPLGAASEAEFLPTVTVLLAAGASIEHKSKAGWSALSSAVVSGDTDVVKALLEAGAAVRLTEDTVLRRALLSANQNDFADVVKLILLAETMPPDPAVL